VGKIVEKSPENDKKDAEGERECRVKPFPGRSRKDSCEGAPHFLASKKLFDGLEKFPLPNPPPFHLLRALMYQLNFSDQSMSELNKLGKFEQMQLVEALSAVTPERLDTDRSTIGAINREGTTFYRLRVEDFRLYFEIRENTIFCNYILQSHSVADFAFRMKLPFTEEHEIEQDQSFWKYLKSLTK
jgi:mRNA-degrading endonuclease RelE of RelBE toxin-antitoxin system